MGILRVYTTLWSLLRLFSRHPNIVAPLADHAFATDLASLDATTAWLGIWAYSLQIYFDFCGYSNMAVGLAFLLGFTFVGLQAHEYGEAYRELGLRLSTGIYGSTFFMLTGFHGLHVTIGAIMLMVIWFRVLRGHFTPQHHFAFEAVAWYWHFVDGVWVVVFTVVYLLGR